MSDGSDADLIASLVGHRIERAEWGDYLADKPNEWGGCDYGRLWLDDGRVIEFHAWGHDAWGATIGDVTADVSPPG